MLITGASGFIGRHLAVAFHKKGYPVTVQARASSDLTGLAELPDLRIIYGTLEDPRWLSSLEKIDIVLHLALPWSTLNAQTDESFLQTLLVHRPFHLVYFSSVCAAGLNYCRQPIQETDTEKFPPRFLPHDFYGIYKWKVEEIVKQYARRHELNATLLRPTVVYGPGDRKGPLSLFRAIRNDNLMLWHKGENRISFCAIENLVKTTLFLVEHPLLGVRTYHVADPEQMTLKEFCALAAEAMGETLRYRQGSTVFMKPAASLARMTNRLGWTRSFADQYGWAQNIVPDITRLFQDYPNLHFTPTRIALKQAVQYCLSAGDLERSERFTFGFQTFTKGLGVLGGIVRSRCKRFIGRFL